jgi:O-antigen ligase
MLNINIRVCNQILLYVFVFSLAFERAFPFLPGLSFPKAFGIIYIMSLCINPNFIRTFSTGNTHKVVFLLFGIFLLTNVFNGGLFHIAGLKSIDQSFLLNIILMWCLINHAKLDHGILVRSFIYFSLGYLVLVLFYSLGLYQTLSNGRVYMGSALPNALGLNGAIGICGLLSFFSNITRPSWGSVLFVLVSVLLTLSLLLATGSRSALIAVFFVFVMYFFWSSKSIRFVLIVTTMILIPASFDSFSVITDRSVSAIENQELGGRLVTWLLISDIISDNFLFGVGRNGYDFIADLELGYSPSPHNVFLEVFVYGGVLALCLWVSLFYKMGKIALRSHDFEKKHAVVMIIPLLLMVSVAGQVFNNTLMFFLIALIFSVEGVKKVGP